MKRVILTVVLIFFIFSSSTVVYAYYDDAQEVYLHEENELYIVDERLANAQGSTLVPKGVIRASSDVYEIIYEYEVIVKDGLELDAMVDDLLFTNQVLTEEQLNDVFNFDFEITYGKELTHSEHLFAEQEAATQVFITLHVSMNEPATQEIYEALVGGQLAFEVYFKTQ